MVMQPLDASWPQVRQRRGRDDDNGAADAQRRLRECGRRSECRRDCCSVRSQHTLAVPTVVPPGLVTSNVNCGGARSVGIAGRRGTAGRQSLGRSADGDERVTLKRAPLPSALLRALPKAMVGTAIAAASPTAAKAANVFFSMMFPLVGRFSISWVEVPTTEPTLNPKGRSRVRGGSDTDALGEQFAVVRRVTEQQLRRLGPLEVQVRRVLPGEADSAVDLDVLGGGVEVRLAAVRLGQ